MMQNNQTSDMKQLPKKRGAKFLIFFKAFMIEFAL